ncbi:MAG: pyridoxal-dependent decarboxylase [Gemmatimonadetes bacterium]|nr:pyridoxal-dependent decarboxylase [Gemmatimonadota bacterium]
MDSLLSPLDQDLAPAEGERFLALASAYLTAAREGAGAVSTPLSRDELYALFDEPLPADGVPLAELVRRLAADVVPNSIHLAHPMYMGHQMSPPLPAAIWMEPLIGALNQSTAVAEMSPAATAIETRVIRWMCALAGFGQKAGGTLTTGGTEASFTALLAARNALIPDAWENGVGDNPPAIVCGEHAHYAVTRAAGELGLGMRRTVSVPSRGYRMAPDALAATLDRLKAEDVPVMAVVATAGSTATGSFDDLEAIGLLCSERGLWLHVDGAHGASALLSEKHRYRLKGIEHARTIAWDPHKMMLIPLGTGMVLARDEGDLERAFAQSAPYLFHEGGKERRWDQGTRSFMCSRRADALKLWAALQRYGSRRIGLLYDHLCATAHRLWDLIGERDDFVALHEPESNILCFRWVGAGNLPDEALDDVNLRAREAWNRERGWITTTVLDDVRVLRVTAMNPRTTEREQREMLDGVARIATGIAAVE